MSLPGRPHLESLYNHWPFLFNLTTILTYIQFPLAMFMEKAPRKSYKWIVAFPVFLLSWWPITFYAFFTQNNKQWSHTEHTRVIRLEEVQSEQAS
jgi:hypothetical protein